MAVKAAHIKVTYSLDAATVMAVRELSEKWCVAQSEAVRRSIRAAAERADADQAGRLSREQAVALYQAASRLTAQERERWIKDIRAERQAGRKSATP